MVTCVAIARAAIPTNVTAALDQLPAYSVGDSLVPMKTIDAYAQRLTANDPDRAALANRLIELLAASGAKIDTHAFLGRELALVAGEAQIADLAKLLRRPETVEAARYALTAMEHPAASAALRDVVKLLTGSAFIGAMQSMGEIHDELAVPVLAEFAARDDASSIAALGRMSIPKAADVLVTLPVEQSAAARVACAARLPAGEGERVLRLVSPLLEASVSEDRRVTALFALAVHPTEAGLPALRKAVEDPSDFVAVAAIRLLAGCDTEGLVKAMATRVAGLSPIRRHALFDALSTHPTASARELALAAIKVEPIEPAALTLLGLVGHAEDVDALAAWACGKGEIAEVAQEALARLAAPGTDERIVAAFSTGPAASRPALLEALADRQSSALETVALQAVASADEAIQVAACRALGRGASVAAAEKLVAALAGAMNPAARAAAERAVAVIVKRAEDRTPISIAAGTALASLRDADGAASMLRVLVACGGADSLTQVRTALTRGELRPAALRALIDWPEEAALPDLVAVATKPATDSERTLALRGAVRLALGTAQPAAQLANVLPLAGSKSDRLEVLGALADKPSADAVKIAVDLAVAEPGIRNEAVLAALNVAQGLGRNRGRAVRDELRRLTALELAPDQRAVLQSLVAAPQVGGLRPLSGVEREARVTSVASSLATNEHLVAWLDGGPETQTTGEGPRIVVASGSAYLWEGAVTVAGMSAASIVYDASSVEVELSALAADKAYALLVTWWDFDHADRNGSIAVNGRPALPVTALPSWSRKEAPATVRVAVQGDAAGRAHVSIRNAGGANVAVCELALVETGPATPVAATPVDPNAKKVLIVTGLDYPGHKWRETAPVLRDAIAADRRLAVTINEDIDAALSDPTLGGNAVIVLHYMNWEKPGPGLPSLNNLRAAISNGTGLVMVHFACGAFKDWPEFVNIAGRIYNPKFRGHDPRGPFRVRVVDATHPIMAGMTDFDTDDELYTCLDGQTPIHPLADANSKADHKDYPMAFVLNYGKGRVFHCTLGHDVKALSVPAVKELYRRAAAWTAGLTPTR